MKMFFRQTSIIKPSKTKTMKTIFTFLSSFLLSFSLLAADVRHNESSLIIRSADRGEIRVVIDGHHRFESRNNFMRIRNIDGGSHRVKIYRQKQRNGVFGNFGNRFELVYNNSIRVRKGMNINISIDRYGRASVYESRANGYGNGRNDRGWRNGTERDRDLRNERDMDDDRDWDRNNDFDFGMDRNSGDYDMNDKDVDWDNRDRNDRNYDDYGYNRAMSDIDFSRVMESIQKEWYEGNKQKSASQIISTNFFTSSQVRQMLQLFSFENTKLELAKQAYGKTVDRGNYYVVNDVFSFSSSKDELNRYIRNFR